MENLKCVLSFISIVVNLEDMTQQMNAIRLVFRSKLITNIWVAWVNAQLNKTKWHLLIAFHQSSIGWPVKINAMTMLLDAPQCA